MSRRLQGRIEPLAANVYFAPEAIAGYSDLGLSYLEGYFCSRSACMGRLTGPAVTATFAVFEPGVVERSVTSGWEKAEVADVLAAREKGATAALERLIGSLAPESVGRATGLLKRSAEAAADRALAGHPIFAGLWSLDWPGTPYGDLWRAADLVREHRGDSHVAAWTSEGVDQVEISLLSELWWGLPPKSFIRTRGFGDEAIDPASDRLESRGLTKAGELTESGRELREAIERATERGSISIMEALGADAEELISLLEVWARAIIDAGAYAVDTIARSDDLSS